MKEIIRRTLIVFWLVGLAGYVAIAALVAFFVLVSFFKGGMEIGVGAAKLGMLVLPGLALLALLMWALQYIATGVVNPLRLLHKTTRASYDLPATENPEKAPQ